MSELYLSVHTVLESKPILVPYISKSTTAEDVCIYVCKQLNIGTVARHLFALRVTNKNVFLVPCDTFSEKVKHFDLRLRYKVPNVAKLRKVDIRAYDYYFHQARNDVLDNKVPEIVCEKHRKELVGLGITDMYRVMLEKDIPRETVENEYKKYIPKEALKTHFFFVKRPIHETLGELQRSSYDASYVKAQYLNQLDIIAPEYLTETYKASLDLDGSVYEVHVKVSPHHPTESGIKYALDSKKEQWHKVCAIEEIGFVSIRNDGTVEISRKNGIPFYLMFQSIPMMLSFTSLLDGYYRLTCKWTFNICKDIPTPSLQKLYSMKCHGPVGGEFSYAKLEEKRNNKRGCFILRESEYKYNTYFIDVCLKDKCKPKTFKLEKITDDEFIFSEDLKKYRNIYQLMAAYSNPDESIYLQECLPPSEYDVSPLLLCQNDNVTGDSVTDSSSLSQIIPSSPLCINCKDLQVYKGIRKEGCTGITMVYRAMWRITKGKKIEVAMKILKQESCDNYLKEFLNIASQWAFLQSSAIVRLFGISLTTNVSLVMEYFKLGPLDQYLQSNKQMMKTVDLIEASSNLASALWHLKENGVVHGKIRCRKLMVSTHDDNSFTVKLTDPGIITSYASKDVHWIPPECYSKLDYAKRSAAADVWAFATTVWEIFTYGEEIKTEDHIEAMKWYCSGKRLPKPPDCPDDIYKVLRECWEDDPYRRKQAQALVRDVNQIFYEVYNSRRTHQYAKISIKPKSALHSYNGLGSSSTNSGSSDPTLIDGGDDLISASEVESTSSASSTLTRRLSKNWIGTSRELLCNYQDSSCDDFSNLLSTFNLSTATTSLDSINSMQSIFELDSECNVVLQGRIGQGFYGEVYKGTLEYVGDEGLEPRKVAVKKVKTTAMSSCLKDFEREIEIMKKLKHPNIVEILGVLNDPEISLVMEYVQHGSLQNYLKIYRESLTIKQLLKYALDIAEGMSYLGKKNIVHRDLAARNILVVDESHVKISDFGLAQVIGTNDYYILKTNREMPVKWYAPESIKDGKFSVRSDVWSYGVTLYEMFSFGDEPKLSNVPNETNERVNQQAFLDALLAGSRFPCPQFCPKTVYVRIIHECWNIDPHKRPSFSQLIPSIQYLLSEA